MNVIKWTIKKIFVENISIRMHTNPWTEKEEPYAVIYCGPCPVEGRKEEHPKHSIKKRNAFMCFEEPLFRRVVAEQEYGFAGKVNFNYGNTFLVCTHIYDCLGIDVTDENSICYDLWNEEYKEDCTLDDSEMGAPEIAEE